MAAAVGNLFAHCVVGAAGCSRTAGGTSMKSPTAEFRATLSEAALLDLGICRGDPHGGSTVHHH
jgi:hypothetical protein